MLNERLILLRTSKKYTKKQVAEYLLMTPEGYGYYESAKRVPSPEVLLKLSKFYNVSTDYLLGKSDEIKNSSAELSTEDKLRLYFYDKVGREPTQEELYRLDNFADTFIKGLQK